MKREIWFWKRIPMAVIWVDDIPHIDPARLKFDEPRVRWTPAEQEHLRDCRECQVLLVHIAAAKASEKIKPAA
jgi:hypothetical protein